MCRRFGLDALFVTIARSMDIIRGASVKHPSSIRFDGCLYERWRSDDIAGAACTIYAAHLEMVPTFERVAFTNQSNPHGPGSRLQWVPSPIGCSVTVVEIQRDVQEIGLCLRWIRRQSPLFRSLCRHGRTRPNGPRARRPRRTLRILFTLSVDTRKLVSGRDRI